MEIDEKKEYQKVTSAHMKGFTTIELIIVVVVAGIMAAIALPKLGNTINSVDLYSAAKQVKSDIRYTQEQAMSRYAIRKIVFPEGGYTYYIKDSSDNIIEEKKLPKRSKAIFDSGSTALIFTFNSSGEPIVGGGGMIRISSKGSVKVIAVYSTTGKVSILN